MLVVGFYKRAFARTFPVGSFGFSTKKGIIAVVSMLHGEEALTSTGIRRANGKFTLALRVRRTRRGMETQCE